MQNFITNHSKLISALHTFLAVSVLTLASNIATIPADTLLTPNTWTSAFVWGIVASVLRAAVKSISPLVDSTVQS